MQGREFVEFSVIIVPLQLPDDKTECKVKNNCVPGYVSTHSNGKKPAARAPFSLCCAFPPVKEAAFHFSLLVLVLSHLRELKRKLRFFCWGRADGLRLCWVDAG